MGTVISEEYPFLSASPDLQVSCECCGTGLVEIKCPYSIRDKSPFFFHFFFHLFNVGNTKIVYNNNNNKNTNIIKIN